MKTVTLNDAGYTADGKWRLVLVEPTRDLPDGDSMIAQLAAKIEGQEAVGEVYLNQKTNILHGALYDGGCPVGIKLYAQPGLALAQVSDEPVIDRPVLPPGWFVVRVPDVEFQPRDQIYISKIGVDGRAERGGTACKLDDSSLFWHFFNDWLLTQEGTD